jgi:hypothetical protein
MAIWGISTTTETLDNNYAIPKHLSDVDRNRTPHNCFADQRGWVYRNYGTRNHNGLSTSYYDEILVPVVGLNTTGIGSNRTGLGAATPVAIFFEDPNLSSPISISAGATTFISTSTSAPEVHLVYNELVHVTAGATVLINTFDANNANQSTSIVATATSIARNCPVHNFFNDKGITVSSNYNGQITNRVAFTFTPPTTVLTAQVNFNTTAISATVAAGSSVIFVNSVSGVSAGSSLSVTGAFTNANVVSVGATSVTIGTGSTSASSISAGVAATFSTRTTQTNLQINLSAGVVGVITDSYDGGAVTKTFTSDIIRNVGGGGTTGSLGTGTQILSVRA